MKNWGKEQNNLRISYSQEVNKTEGNISVTRGDKRAKETNYNSK